MTLNLMPSITKLTRVKFGRTKLWSILSKTWEQISRRWRRLWSKFWMMTIMTTCFMPLSPRKFTMTWEFFWWNFWSLSIRNHSQRLSCSIRLSKTSSQVQPRKSLTWASPKERSHHQSPYWRWLWCRKPTETPAIPNRKLLRPRIKP